MKATDIGLVRTDAQLRPYKTPMREDALDGMVTDRTRIFYALMLSRSGAEGCLSDLEHTHYSPGTPRNELFTLVLLTWGDLVWALIGIPQSDKEFMARAAAANGLRVADGVPHIVDGYGIHRFPAHGPNVFTLENVSGHPVYGRRKSSQATKE